MSLWRVSTLRSNTLQHLWNCHYIAKNGIAEENQLLRNGGEILYERRSDIWEIGVTEVIIMIKHRGTEVEWENDPL
jgi:hypothetical protein